MTNILPSSLPAPDPVVLHDDGAAARRRADRARTVGFLAALVAAFAIASTAVPGPDVALTLRVAVLAGAGGLAGVLLWLRARHVSALLLWPLGLGTTGLAAAAAVSVSLEPGATRTLSVDHRAWMVGVALFCVALLLVRQLVVELQRRVRLFRELARIDPLTRVANRAAFDEEVVREMSRARRDQYTFCIAVLDVDHFKNFNDMRGHDEGNRFLQHLALLWAGCVRASDFLARHGGESFALMLRACQLEDAFPIIERLRMSVGEDQTCSAGLACWDGTEPAEAVVTRAERALHEAKNAGRNCLKVSVAEGMSASSSPLVDWPAVIRRLLEDRSVIAAFQPVVRLSDGAVVGFEALARPGRRADMSVERMFSSAQRMGLGRDLDWLCRRAALFGASELPAGVPLFVNVGLSALVDPLHRVDQMLLLLQAAGRRPEDVVLEITERELVGDLRRLREVVASYRRERFRLAIDDVGEGHSTLEVLSVVEPDFVKVARTLVVAVANRGPRAAIRAVVAFSNECRAHVIAEGIETAGSAQAMRDLGVTLGQGWLYGKPVIPELSRPGPVHTETTIAAPTHIAASWR